VDPVTAAVTSPDERELRALVDALSSARADPDGTTGLVGLVVVPGAGVGIAAAGRRWSIAADPAQVVLRLTDAVAPRWVWWAAQANVRALLPAGVRIRACWDLAAVHLLVRGGHRQDPAAIWAGAHDRPEPARSPARGGGAAAALFDVGPGGTVSGALTDELAAQPVGADGQLDPSWAARDWSWFQGDGTFRQGAGPDPEPRATGRTGPLLDAASRWAALALEVQAHQERALRAIPDPRPSPLPLPLPVLTAYAESAAAVLATELEFDGLPIDRAAAEEFIAEHVGPRPCDAAEEVASRARRDAEVLRRFPAAKVTGAGSCDLRNPAQVRELLARSGFHYPDTRSWRLEPFRSTHAGVAALLDWRKAERIGTTYGYHWLDRHVGADDRLRGGWGAADAAAGRMTAQAGLHNLPAGLRVAVVAERGHVLVRADLGQIEPRVLAAVSGDPGLTAATRSDDLYAPVAEALRSDRPTAKVAVLAAMYGQTSGAAGTALAGMERSFPQAIAYLRAAEQAGHAGQDLRTFGGRLIRLNWPDLPPEDLPDALASVDVPPGSRPPVSVGRGRFARNAVIQGAAAELFKAWAARVRAALLPLAGRIVLCLHDELLVHVPEEHADEAAGVLSHALDSTAATWAAGSNVRFVADITCVRRWSDAKG
jgi:DNA polymerase I